MNNPTAPNDAAFTRLEAIHWHTHAPSTLCLAVPAGFKGMRTTIAECSGYGRDIDLSISDARRLAACWNALAGVPTEEIERGGAMFAAGPLLHQLLAGARDAIAALAAISDMPRDVSTQLLANLDLAIVSCTAEGARQESQAAIAVAQREVPRG